MKQPEERKSARVSIRLTQAERKALEELAKQNEKTISQVLYSLIKKAI